MNRQLMTDTEAAEREPLSRHVVACKAFRFYDVAAKASIDVCQGDRLDTARLQAAGLDVAKLVRTQFVRRADG